MSSASTVPPRLSVLPAIGAIKRPTDTGPVYAPAASGEAMLLPLIVEDRHSLADGRFDTR